MPPRAARVEDLPGLTAPRPAAMHMWIVARRREGASQAPGRRSGPVQALEGAKEAPGHPARPLAGLGRRAGTGRAGPRPLQAFGPPAPARRERAPVRDASEASATARPPGCARPNRRRSAPPGRCPLWRECHASLARVHMGDATSRCAAKRCRPKTSASSMFVPPRLSCQAIAGQLGKPSSPSRTTGLRMLVTPRPTTSPGRAASGVPSAPGRGPRMSAGHVRRPTLPSARCGKYPHEISGHRGRPPPLGHGGTMSRPTAVRSAPSAAELRSPVPPRLSRAG